MGRNKKKKLLSVFLIISMLAGLLNLSMTAFAQSGNNIVSENEAAFYEITSQESEDSQSVTVNLKLTPKKNVKVKQVTLPDTSIVEYQNQDIIYTAQKKGSITFILHYLLNEELKETRVDYEVTEIGENQMYSTTSEVNEEAIRETVQEYSEKKGDFFNISSPKETSYYGSEMITSNIVIDGRNIKTPLESTVLEVELPTTLISYSNFKKESFIDHASMPKILGIGASPQVVTQDGTTKIKITLPKIDSTTYLKVPFIFSFTDRLTPDGYSIVPKITLYDKDGNVLEETNDQEYKIKYPERKATKNILGIDSKGYAYAGRTKEGDETRISETMADVVPFIFGLSSNSNKTNDRYLEMLEITDTIPTYTNSKGETVVAKFDQAINPDWVDNGDGTVSTTVHLKSTNIFANLDISDDLNAVRLNLLFPDALIQEKGKAVQYTNTATIKEIPFNKAENEDVTHNISKDFYLKAETLNGDGLIKKYYRGGDIAYDVNSLYLERPTYRFTFTNKYASPLTEITLTEDGDKFDSRLFLAEINYLSIHDPRPRVFGDHVKIRAYRKDGSYKDIQLNKNAKLNEAAENKLEQMAEDVNNGKVNAEATRAVEPEFVKFSYVFEDGFSLKPGETLSGDVRMAFKDPYHVEYSDKIDIKNVISLDCIYTTAHGEKIDIHTSSDASGRFVPLKEKAVLSKSTRGQKSGSIGEKIEYDISLDMSGLSKARYLKNPTFIDLLPKGVSFTKFSKINGVYNSGKYIEGYETLGNYKNTGRTAVKIKFKSDIVGKLKGGDANCPYVLKFFISDLEINEDIIPTRAETDSMNNDNHVYFFTDDDKDYPDEISSDDSVKDSLDINDNGKTGDKILMASSKTLGTQAEQIFSTKSIRSIEPGEDEADLNYDSVWVDSIKTNYSGKAEIYGRFQYRLQIHNYTKDSKNSFVFYDVLPYKDDAEGSNFANEFMGNVTVSVGDTDITDRFDIYYRTDRYPSNSVMKEVNSANWTQAPDSISDVTAIKAIMKDDVEIDPYTILTMTWDMKAPDYDSSPNLGNQSAYNTFYVSYNGGQSFKHGNTVKNTLPVKWEEMLPSTRSISVKKNWVGKAEKEVIVNLLANGKKVRNVKLNEANGWSHDFTEMPVLENIADKEVIQYTVEEELIDGYTSKVSGNMKDGFVITNRQITSPAEVKGKSTDDKVNRNNGSKQENSSIKTGDFTNIHLFLGLSGITLLVIIVLFVSRKYHNDSKKIMFVRNKNL